MMKKVPCPKCNGWGHISEVHENGVSGYQCKECLGTGQIEVPMTNADRIRAMTDEELSDFLGEWAWKHLTWMMDSRGELIDWLQQPCGGAD